MKHVRQLVLILLLLIIAVTPVLASNYSNEVLNWSGSSLVGYWRWTDVVSSTTVADAGPNSLPGTVVGGITFGSTALVTGSADTSASPNGTSGCASLGSAGESYFHNWDVSNAWTFEAIIKPNFTRTNSVFEGRTLFSKINPSSPFNGWTIDVDFNDHRANKAIIEAIFSNAGITQNWYGTADLTNGNTYHIVVAYDGLNSPTSWKFAINGVDDAITFDNGGGTISTVVTNFTPYIGCRDGSEFFYKGNIQEEALYNVNHPAGYESGMNGASIPGDNLAWYHYNLQQGSGSPVANPPSVPNVFWDDDVTDDIGGVNDIQMLIWLHKNRYINLIGIGADTADVNSASVARAILDHWGMQSTPVYAYQGNGFAGNTQNFSASTAAQFRPQDATNVGINSTLGTISVVGTSYVVGDVLTVPGGTIATGAVPATITVTGVSSGGITSARVSNSGSYSTAPTSPVTLPNPHSGTPAVIAFTTLSRRGNYTDPNSGLIDLFNQYSNVVYIMGGTGLILQPFLQNNSAEVIASISALLIDGGLAPSNTYWALSPDYNLASSAAAYNYINANWPSAIPIVEFGSETTSPQTVAGCFIYGGPANVTNATTDPVEWAATQVSGVYVSGHLRCNWEIHSYLYAAFGVRTTGGNAYSEYNFYGANKGTETIDASTGANSFANTAGNWSYMRRRATDAQFNALMVTMMAAVPSNFSSGALLDSGF